MSIDIIKEQINKFLSSETPEVMAIKGKWGVGKTYTWNKFLKEAGENGQVELKSYSYVSLFGINSLDAFKYSIFEHTVDNESIGMEASIETFQQNTVSNIKSYGKKLLPQLESISRIFTKVSFTSTIESIAFFSISKTIICIDDLERRGKNLELKDVLGLVSLLKEQKRCKVIFLLNDGEDGSDDYKKYREKVVDFELEFSPTAEDCANIAFDGTPLDEYISQILKESTVKLSINNIRILKKIERLILLTIPYLGEYEKQITDQAVHSLTLFSWCYFCEKTEDIPTLDFIANLECSMFGLNFDEGDSDIKKKWKTILTEYGYRRTDEFDLLLLRIVKAGYLIETEFKDIASKKNNEVIAEKSAQSYYDAWDLYRDSFDDNQDEVVKSIYENFKKYTKFIKPYNLGGTVTLFRELGEDDKAEELIDLYISNRRDEADLFNPDSFSYFGGIKDQSIIDKFSATYNASVALESAEQVLERVAGINGCNSEDLKILSNITISEYYDIFKRCRIGSKHRSLVKTCLQFGQNPSEESQKISESAIQALKLIAKESSINKSRVKSYNVQLDE